MIVIHLDKFWVLVGRKHHYPDLVAWNQEVSVPVRVIFSAILEGDCLFIDKLLSPSPGCCKPWSSATGVKAIQLGFGGFISKNDQQT